MKEKEVSTQRGKVTQCDMVVNTAYMMVLTMELMIRDVERRLAVQKATIQREKKMNFNRFMDFTKKALIYAEKLTENIYEVDEPNHWRNVQTWQDESNELARLVLMYADRSADINNVEQVFKLLRELPGEGIVDENMLDYYRLKK